MKGHIQYTSSLTVIFFGFVGDPQSEGDRRGSKVVNRRLYKGHKTYSQYPE